MNTARAALLLWSLLISPITFGEPVTVHSQVEAAWGSPMNVLRTSDYKVFPGQHITVTAKGSVVLNRREWSERKCKVVGLFDCSSVKHVEQDVRSPEDEPAQILLRKAGSDTAISALAVTGTPVEFDVPGDVSSLTEEYEIAGFLPGFNIGINHRASSSFYSLTFKIESARRLDLFRDYLVQTKPSAPALRQVLDPALLAEYGEPVAVAIAQYATQTAVVGNAAAEERSLLLLREASDIAQGNPAVALETVKYYNKLGRYIEALKDGFIAIQLIQDKINLGTATLPERRELGRLYQSLAIATREKLGAIPRADRKDAIALYAKAEEEMRSFGDAAGLLDVMSGRAHLMRDSRTISGMKASLDLFRHMQQLVPLRVPGTLLDVSRDGTSLLVSDTQSELGAIDLGSGNISIGAVYSDGQSISGFGSAWDPSRQRLLVGKGSSLSWWDPRTPMTPPAPLELFGDGTPNQAENGWLLRSRFVHAPAAASANTAESSTSGKLELDLTAPDGHTTVLTSTLDTCAGATDFTKIPHADLAPGARGYALACGDVVVVRALEGAQFERRVSVKPLGAQPPRVALSGNLRLLAVERPLTSGDTQPSVTLLDLSTPKPQEIKITGVVPGPPLMVSSFRFSRDGRRLFLLMADGRLGVLDTSTGKITTLDLMDREKTGTMTLGLQVLDADSLAVMVGTNGSFEVRRVAFDDLSVRKLGPVPQAATFGGVVVPALGSGGSAHVILNVMQVALRSYLYSANGKLTLAYELPPQRWSQTNRAAFVGAPKLVVIQQEGELDRVVDMSSGKSQAVDEEMGGTREVLPGIEHEKWSMIQWTAESGTTIRTYNGPTLVATVQVPSVPPEVVSQFKLPSPGPVPPPQREWLALGKVPGGPSWGGEYSLIPNAVLTGLMTPSAAPASSEFPLLTVDPGNPKVRQTSFKLQTVISGGRFIPKAYHSQSDTLFGVGCSAPAPGQPPTCHLYAIRNGGVPRAVRDIEYSHMHVSLYAPSAAPSALVAGFSANEPTLELVDLADDGVESQCEPCMRVKRRRIDLTDQPRSTPFAMMPAPLPAAFSDDLRVLLVPTADGLEVVDTTTGQARAILPGAIGIRVTSTYAIVQGSIDHVDIYRWPEFAK